MKFNPAGRTISLSRIFLFSALIFCAIQPAFGAGLRFHWEDSFSTSEQQALRTWIETTDSAITNLVGELPFVRHIYFHRAGSGSGPVPWAHTERGRRQGVHLHVDTSHDMSVFYADWTAPHELSHLIIPYLGESNSWFAEGFASYMQFQVMGEMGILDANEIESRYTHRFKRAEGKFHGQAQRFDEMPFAMAAPKLRASRQYPTMYWGGAVYFWQVDQWLRAHTQGTLAETLAIFVDCCRVKTRNIDQLMAALDNIASERVFSQCMATFRQQPGFPDFRAMPSFRPSNQFQ